MENVNEIQEGEGTSIPNEVSFTDEKRVLHTLKLKRGTVKGKLTRFLKYLCNINEENISIVELKKRLNNTTKTLEEFDQIQENIEMINVSDENELIRDEFEKDYYFAVSQAEKLLASSEKVHCLNNINNLNNMTAFTANQSSNSISTVAQEVNMPLTPPLTILSQNQASSSFQTVNSQLNNSNHNVCASYVNLPAIPLPTFSGDIKQWPKFVSAFTAFVNRNENLDTFQKFYYLRGSLKGDALKVIEEMGQQDENYESALELLKARFDKKNLIKKSHVDALFNIDVVQKDNSKSLRTFLDEFNMHIRALANLGEAVDTWDILVLRLLSPKLDFRTKREWEATSSKLNEPKLKDFRSFLENRCQFLENLETSVDKMGKSENSNKFTNKYSKNSTTLVATYTTKCLFCKGDHLIYYCKNFSKLSIKNRLEEVKKLKMCTNCLKLGHTNSACKGFLCRICQKRHNTLLHFDNEQEQGLSIETKIDSIGNIATTGSAYCCFKNEPRVLLTTAVIYIENNKGNWVKCRALLDNGSQTNFITKELCSDLNLKKERINIPVKGIGTSLSTITEKIHAKIKSNYNEYQKKLPFLVINKITDNIPSTFLNLKDLLPNVKLADPEFCYPNKIDLLLGAGIFWELLCVGQIQLGPNKPILQKSKLGWLVSGPLNGFKKEPISCNLATNDFQLNSQLEQFWLIENVESERKYSPEEEECEKIFKSTSVRDRDGRFVIQLPIKKNISDLGNSRKTAIKRLASVEHRFNNNPYLKKRYVEFMREYLELGHMSEINNSSDSSENMTYYLPHHGVLKEDSLTTKLRVVFDASSKTDQNISLNDMLLTGPTLQDDLFSIIVRFRKHKYVIIADIAKMYRQILIQENQRDLQKIIWRESSKDELKEYRLNTLTYGTSPASFIATRCLHQLAYENEVRFPVACKTILKDFYMDDLITGSDTLDNTIQLRDEITEILQGGCFPLRKWLSNDVNVLDFQGKCNTENLSQYIISDNSCVKTLGLLWNARDDHLKVSSHLKQYSCVTKRTILSVIAQIFDPMGLVGPITLKGKILLQKLWQIKSGWDESVPIDIFTEWKRIEEQLIFLNDLSIPRYISQSCCKILQIHGFCDASEAAYGACLYLRTINDKNVVKTGLICAKSRVAPLKRLTIPRLELSGALLLAKLSNKVIEALDINIEPSQIFYWCDSTIVLHWLMADSSRWKIFVGNRVAEIQRTTSINQWYHINTNENPADIISRGCFPRDLIDCSLWWYGPPWLSLHSEDWPKLIDDLKFDSMSMEDDTETKVCLTVYQCSDIFAKFSNLNTLMRVFAYMRRFMHNTLAKRRGSEKRFGVLSCDEVTQSLNHLIKISQEQHFPEDYDKLSNGKSISKNSKLAALKPFIDNNSIIRVGGRISKSQVSYDQKFPIILPNNHALTKSIALYYHLKLFHAGAQHTLASIRLKYWPLKARSLVRYIVHKCVVCFKVNPRSIYPIMGELPEQRVLPTRPFYNSGLDYAGPFLVKDGKCRNRKLVKCYLCIFVCFSTKAVHFELAGDLTSETFLKAFQRFTSRRGLCKNLFSDNATNFRGANRELIEILRCLKNSKNDQRIMNFLNENNIEWHFIPANSPHMGGLWEAAVKSAKFHLKRIVGNMICTYEDLYTIFVQIEAILNSRPLTPLSDDPSDLMPLTPSHFLIGEVLTATPQRSYQDLPINRLTRYQRLQQAIQHFWRRWTNEYLSTLSNRSKWRFPTNSQIRRGDLVLLKCESTPPMVWPLGRITDLHPGEDETVRVVSVRTAGGTVKRAVSRLCVLPIDTTEKVDDN